MSYSTNTEIGITAVRQFYLQMSEKQIPQSFIPPTFQVYNFVTAVPVPLMDWILMGHRKHKQMTNISQ